MASSKSTALGTCISCTFGFVFCTGMLPDVAQGPIGLMLLGAAVLAGIISLFGGNIIRNTVRLVCAVGLVSVLGYALGTAPSNPYVQHVASEQLANMLGSVRPNTATSVALPALVAATASTTLLSTPMVAPAATQAPAGHVAPAPTAESQVLTAIVFNGGNIRESAVDGRVLDQINAHERVQLVKKNQQSSWYFIVNERNVGGWVSRTLLDLPPGADSQVPIAEE